MKVSLNIIKQFINFELPPVDKLVARINAQLGGVEQVIDLGAKYKDARIVRVVSAEKHPDADKLSICKVDDGGVVPGIERDEHGYVQVVCGAPNVHGDMWAVWLPPKATVPSTFETEEPFVLDARKLRGVMSYGMLAAGDELDINSDHDGIIEITESAIMPQKRHFRERFSEDQKRHFRERFSEDSETEGLKAGASFAEMFGLDDTIIDIENKMFTHRPDCFGQLGVAREIAGILGHSFESPKWYKTVPDFATGEGLALSVFNDTPSNVPRIMFAAMKDVEITPSPLWLQCALVAMGSKPINNVVDVTNYVMLLTAQPTHAYDYDKIRGSRIGARMARSGEKVTLLNGKTYELTSDDIVIADSEGVVGLAGIMGGSDSEVDAQTRNIVLEVGTFDMYALRKTAMRHGVFTDALARFNKGQSPLQNPIVMGLLMSLLSDVSGAELATGVCDETSDVIRQAIEANEPVPTLTIAPGFIRDRLGIDMPKHEMVQLLANVEFPLCEDCGWNPEDAQDNIDDLHVNVPFWRMDIQDPEDMVEEIGRLYGFDKLPRELPHRSITPVQKNARHEAKRKIRDSLSRAGANEVLTYSFVHENTLKKAEQDTAQAFKLSNALSPDLQYYRLSVLPSLLDKVHMNIKAGHDEFTLFEIGKGHNKKYHADDDNGLPRELDFVDMVYTSKKPHDGAPYYYLRTLLTQLARDYGFTLKFAPITEALDYPVTAPFDQSRSALVTTWNGEFIGMVGELKQSVLKNFKLPAYTAAATLDLAGLQNAIDADRQTYTPLSKFPSTSRDVSLAVAADTSYLAIMESIMNACKDIPEQVRTEGLGVYQADDSDTKNITFRFHLSSQEKTLSGDEATAIVDTITHAMCAATNGKVV
jgi:phenylalanyl-tRNA synthetase beta chain